MPQRLLRLLHVLPFEGVAHEEVDSRDCAGLLRATIRVAYSVFAIRSSKRLSDAFGCFEEWT